MKREVHNNNNNKNHTTPKTKKMSNIGRRKTTETQDKMCKAALYANKHFY